MSAKTKIDSAGRLVIPKEFRDRYGLTAGAEVEIVPVPDGVTLIPSRREHRMVRRGRVVAIDTGAGVAPITVFDIDDLRSSHLDHKAGPSK